MKSKKNSFIGTSDKLLKSLALSLLGALATWVLTTLPEMDLGAYTPFIGALAPFVANAINQFIKERK